MKNKNKLGMGGAIGVATDNIGVWIAIGVALGAGIGNRMNKKENDDNHEQS